MCRNPEVERVEHNSTFALFKTILFFFKSSLISLLRRNSIIKISKAFAYNLLTIELRAVVRTRPLHEILTQDQFKSVFYNTVKELKGFKYVFYTILTFLYLLVHLPFINYYRRIIHCYQWYLRIASIDPNNTIDYLRYVNRYINIITKGRAFLPGNEEMYNVSFEFLQERVLALRNIDSEGENKEEIFKNFSFSSFDYIMGMIEGYVASLTMKNLPI